MSDDTKVKAVVNTMEQGMDDLKEALQAEGSLWGKEVWGTIMAPSDPEKAAEAKQKEAENKQKDAANAAEQRRFFQTLIQMDAKRLQDAKQKQMQQAQVEEVEVKQKEQVKEVKKVQKRAQVNQGVYDAERHMELRGKQG
jgi:hypothetical protein